MHRLLALALVFAACDDNEPGGPFGTSRVQRKEVPFGWAADLDLLIVVDNSPAMEPFRATLTAQAAQIAALFETQPVGMPNVHIGVVTSDLGAEGVLVPGCTGNGDAGKLRTATTISGTFISDVAAGDGSRMRNYQGSLADAIGDLLDIGADGCPYSRPLLAAQRALDNTVDNAAFLRRDASLAVVFITPQDDCSFADAAFLDGSTSTDTSRCVSGVNALPAIEDFVANLKARKADPTKVVVGGVIAPTSPTCAAQTATRMHSLLQMFPNRASETSICGSDYIDAFATISQLFKILLGIPCFESNLLDADLETPGAQYACSASYKLADGTEDLLPECAPGGNGLCWRIREDGQNCTSSGLSLVIDTHGRAYPYGALATIECLVAE